MTDHDMLHSLGFMINLKKRSGADKTTCQGVVDYHEFLADVEQQAVSGSAIAGFDATHQFVPLADITLTQLQYSDAVDQIYSGLHFMVISLQYPPLNPISVPNRPSYFDAYVGGLSGDSGRTKADVESIMARMDDILAGREQTRQRVNGLVVGRVQSGKTRNYVGLMLKAVDEGYNVIIVLTSPSTALADQTQTRIEKDFFRAKAYDGQMLNFRSSAKIPSPTAILSSTGSTFFWGVAMKQRNNLENIFNWLTENSRLAQHMRVLVVDDEADNATPDSNAGSSKTFSDGEIEDLVAVIRDEDDSERDFSDLADWVDGLPSFVEGKFIEAKRAPGGELDRDISYIRLFLDSPGTIASKRNEILGGYRFVEFLDLQMNIVEDARQYFYKPRGNGSRTMGTFVKLLRTVFNVAEERSAISSLICKLIDRPLGSNDYTFPFQRCAYVAYTATPYACILNERPDETPLYADFIKSLQLSPRYFGLDRIFGCDLKDPAANMKIVDSISDGDVRFVLKPIQRIKDRKISPPAILNVSQMDPDLCYTCQDPAYTGCWDSLRRALAWAFCTAGARAWFRREKYIPRINARIDLDDEGRAKKLAELDYRWTTMLVNISQKRDSHSDQVAAIKRYLDARCATSVDRSAFLNQCEATWNYLTSTFTKLMFDGLFNSSGGSDDYGSIADYPVWAEIAQDVRSFLDNYSSRVHAIVINSENQANRDQQDLYNQVGAHKNELRGDHLWIVCGGNTISRGLTLIGLTTSYFDRVRKTVAVDTLTQMGRWFGYREDYELLPRLWMTDETVKELKKTAIVERRMHESMQENFAAGFSPSDPAHYQQIYCWGRKLSGRARAQSRMLVSIGTTATTDDISTSRENAESIYTHAQNFISRLGTQAFRPAADFRIYNTFPLWEKVPKETICAYLTSLLPDYPERSEAVLRSLLSEIENAEADTPDDLMWDVVIGEPASHRGASYPIGTDREIASGNPSTVIVQNGIAHYTSVRSDTAFYTMIPTDAINLSDEVFVRESIDDVVGVIERKTMTNGGVLPTQFATALADYPGDDVKGRVLALLDAVHANPRINIPPCLRDCLPEGFRNRSAAKYREQVHDMAHHRRPTLQLYLLTPPPDAEAMAVPLVAHAFYWPNHLPDEFHAVAAGLPPSGRQPRPTVVDFARAVEDVLFENGFPMTPGGGLRAQVIARLTNCDEDFFNQNIARPPNGSQYAKVADSDAYYHTSWAEDPVSKLREFVVDRAVEILGDHNPHEARDLATQIMAENGKLEGVFPLVHVQRGGQVHVSDKWNSVFTSAVIAAKGIQVTCRRPITYVMP